MVTVRSPVNLRTEYITRPLNIEADAPRFSWEFSPEATIQQSAYQILVASDSDILAADEGDVWDSGFEKFAAMTNVEYAGAQLTPGERYYWKVRIQDQDGQTSAWSDPTWFETAISPEDWEAEWIGMVANTSESPEPSPALRKSISITEAPDCARLHVTAAGSYDFFINGERVGDRLLDPAVTNYDKRVLYSSYDVTDLLQAGENVLGSVLGRGRYALTTPSIWEWHDTPWQSDVPHISAHLEMTFPDGGSQTVITDGSWRTTESPTLFDSIYEGETYDGRETLDDWQTPGYDDSDWATATTVDGPAGTLRPQHVQPMQHIETIEPELVNEVDDETYVFDFGQMTAGWTELFVDGPEGTEITLTHGERLHDDGTVDVEQEYIDGKIQTDTYIVSGDGVETWEPRFSYRGFRYAMVENYPGEPDRDSLVAKTIHTAIEDGDDSRFTCSNELLNHIQENTRRALLNNHHGIPTDTPTLEKNGWTGDAQLTAETAIYNFDMVRFYEKWLADIADSQRDSGEIPPIVPTSGWGYSDFSDEGIRSPNPAWDITYVLLPWWTYQYYNDTRVLEDHYDGMKELVAYMGSLADDEIIDVGLGDWLPPKHGESIKQPPEGPAITSTAYYYRMAEILAATADTLGKKEDSESFTELAERVRTSFNATFLDTTANIYSTGETDQYRQTSNVFPLAFDIVPDTHRNAVARNLVNDVVEMHDTHLNTGILGTKYLLPVLTDHGYVDAAYDVATQRTYPSWGFWIENGATALYEAWELDARSRDHHMFGSISEWFYTHLAGIKPESPGFQVVSIDPTIPSDLDSVTATVDTIRGPITVDWNDSDSLMLDVDLPANTTASVHGPDDSTELRVNGQPVDEVSGVRAEGGDPDHWTVSSGSWTFQF